MVVGPHVRLHTAQSVGDAAEGVFESQLSGRVIFVSFARSFLEAIGTSFPSKPKPHPAVSLEDFLWNCNRHRTPSEITTKQ